LHAPLFVFAVVALEVAHVALALEDQQVRADAVEEEAVVADDDDAAAETEQCLFQHAQGVHVEVVGGFVEQEDVAAFLEELGEVAAVALAAGEVLRHLLLVCAAEAEAREVLTDGHLAAADLDFVDTAADLVDQADVALDGGALLIDIGDVDGGARLDRRRGRACPCRRSGASWWSCRCRSGR
jgi:hypothetical protein